MPCQSSVPLFLDQMEMHPTSTFMVDCILFTASTPEKSQSVRFSAPAAKSPVDSLSYSTLTHTTAISPDSDSEGSVSTPVSSMSSNTPICHLSTSLVATLPAHYRRPMQTPGCTGNGKPNINPNGMAGSKDSKKIPKPVGEVGRPGREGYNLEKAL
ncbi:hypothetical protein BDP27DRAFT_1429584 [Rhodocollybia butyracea]|uniref:Uncharacterized protein n=1 Tax=Rhodocollybia butyracea TaxID=206335 RepID=A0A9P5PCD2_9AGAR|nr:hypothetical protein BDP27DRAFT_1429584 [Rhodocollybia butyracea]